MKKEFDKYTVEYVTKREIAEKLVKKLKKVFNIKATIEPTMMHEKTGNVRVMTEDLGGYNFMRRIDYFCEGFESAFLD